MQSPTPQPIWDEISVEYSAGTPVKDLAQKYNLKQSCILSYALRHGWQHGRYRNRNGKVKSPVLDLSESFGQLALDRRSAQAKSALLAEIERQLMLLSQYPPTKIGDLLGRGQGRAGVLEQLTAAAAKVCGGWEEQRVGLVIAGDVSELKLLQVNSPPANPLLELVAPAVPGTPTTA